MTNLSSKTWTAIAADPTQGGFPTLSALLRVPQDEDEGFRGGVTLAFLPADEGLSAAVQAIRFEARGLAAGNATYCRTVNLPDAPADEPAWSAAAVKALTLLSEDEDDGFDPSDLPDLFSGEVKAVVENFARYTPGA